MSFQSLNDIKNQAAYKTLERQWATQFFNRKCYGRTLDKTGSNYNLASFSDDYVILDTKIGSISRNNI